MAYDLLNDSLLEVSLPSGERQFVTLPALLSLLGAGKDVTMWALQAHQTLAWHSFLCQLAAISLHRAGQDGARLDFDEATWRSYLVDAVETESSGASATAFELVVDDPTKPAFLQPPVGKAGLKELKNVHHSPEGELYTLITAKNHDVKVDRLSQPTPQHWIFSLVCLQTTEGFLGAGNYGIARMNGGFASRPGVGYSTTVRGTDRFRRDVPILLELAKKPPALFGEHPLDASALIWLLPWDGVKSLSIPTLHPLFIEVCRRVRLSQGSGGEIIARRGSSKVARLDGKALLGNTGDPWTPVEATKGVALTLSETGFTYRKLHEILKMGGPWQQGAAGELRPSDGEEPVLIAQALVRGQGKTGGWHERILRLSPKMKSIFLQPNERQMVGARSEAMIERAKDAQKLLKNAVLIFVQGGPEPKNVDFQDDRAAGAVFALDQEIDAAFFSHLFDSFERGRSDEEADLEWASWLIEESRKHLELAFQSLPVPSARRAQAIARAENRFNWESRRFLPKVDSEESVA